jgi:hypothetical protein
MSRQIPSRIPGQDPVKEVQHPHLPHIDEVVNSHNIPFAAERATTTTTITAISEVSASKTISQSLHTVSVGGSLSVAARDVVQHHHTCHHPRSASRSEVLEEERRRDIKWLKLLVFLDIIISLVEKLINGVEHFMKKGGEGNMMPDTEHGLHDIELDVQDSHSDTSSDSE